LGDRAQLGLGHFKVSSSTVHLELRLLMGLQAIQETKPGQGGTKERGLEKGLTGRLVFFLCPGYPTCFLLLQGSGS